MTDLSFHPVAELFPMMQGEAFDELVEDIKDHGLLEPIWLYEGQVLDGRNRYLACQQAGVEPVFADYQGDDPAGFSVSLNLKRRHLSESQRAMIGAKLANMKAGDNQYTQGRANLPDLSNGDAAEKMNVSARSIKSAKKVQSQGIPELVNQVESGKVKVSIAADLASLPEENQQRIVNLSDSDILKAAKDIRSRNAIARREENERIRQKALAVPPPEGQYRCVVIDPPWPMRKIERDARPNQADELDYPVMTLDEIYGLEIPACDQCHLYLWTTQRFLWDAYGALEHWGFRHLAVMVWHKSGGFQPTGLPQYNCEFVLIGRKGGLEFNTTRDFPLCFEAPRRQHSRKPDAFYDLVSRVSPGPRIDVFSREPRDGFEQFGVERNAFI